MAQENHAFQGLKLIVADDNEADREILRDVLMTNCPTLQLSLASNANEIRNYLKQQHYDCMILDFNLGMDRADAILMDLEHLICDCPVIVISSCPDQGVVISSMRCGSVDFIPKKDAYDGDTLFQRMEVAVRRSRSQIEERRIRERRQRQLTREVYKDPLTGLWNRRYFEELEEGGYFARERRRNTHIMMLDIDHFKSINDTYGHHAGDEVLRLFAKQMAKNERGGMTQLRWGGEEFVILFQTPSLSEAIMWCERLREQLLSHPFEFCEGTKEITFSAGIAGCDTREISRDTIQRADKALYLAKAWGRNQSCTWDMVCADDLIRQIETCPKCSVSDKRIKFLSEFAQFMGRCQQDHTMTHCEDVARLCETLAQRLLCTKEQVNQSVLVGLFHDLGKALIPEEIISDPKPLSKPAKNILNRHSSYSARLAQRLGASPEVVEGVGSHHAPYRSHACLQRPPLLSRIVSVADAVSAMRMNRPYRQALSPRMVDEQLARNIGTQFDPEIVRAFYQ